jgi:D-3-phosphoglycerate dehydrogenase
MLKQSFRYQELFKNFNLEVECPNIVQTLSEEKLCNLLPNYDGWIIGDDPATQKVFEAGKKGKLRAAVKWGVGTDNVDFDACKMLGISITNTPNMFGEEVSDVAIGMLLNLTRKLHIIHLNNINNIWYKPVGETLVGKKICLIGLGDIGRCIARKLLAFKLDIWAVDPAFSKNKELIIGNYGHRFSNKDIFEGIHCINIDTLDNCLEKAQYVICACPLNDKTYHLINKENILKCQNGVKIINVGRGPIVKEEDICDLLDSGFIDSIGFDVFEEEPLSKDSLLRIYSQNIFGSHNGSNTIEAVDKVSKIAIEKLSEFLSQ